MLTTPIERVGPPEQCAHHGVPAIYPNVTVIDFATKAAECPGDCFAADNLHVTPDGARYYANLIAEAAGLEPMQQGASTTSTDVTTTSLPVTDPTVCPRRDVSQARRSRTGSERSRWNPRPWTPCWARPAPPRTPSPRRRPASASVPTPDQGARSLATGRTCSTNQCPCPSSEATSSRPDDGPCTCSHHSMCNCD